MLQRAMDLDRAIRFAIGHYDQEQLIVALEALALHLAPGTAYTSRDLERIAEAFPAYPAVVARRDAELARRRAAVDLPVRIDPSLLSSAAALNPEGAGPDGF